MSYSIVIARDPSLENAGRHLKKACTFRNPFFNYHVGLATIIQNFFCYLFHFYYFIWLKSLRADRKFFHCCKKTILSKKGFAHSAHYLHKDRNLIKLQLFEQGQALRV